MRRWPVSDWRLRLFVATYRRAEASDVTTRWPGWDTRAGTAVPGARRR